MFFIIPSKERFTTPSPAFGCHLPLHRGGFSSRRRHAADGRAGLCPRRGLAPPIGCAGQTGLEKGGKNLGAAGGAVAPRADVVFRNFCGFWGAILVRFPKKRCGFARFSRFSTVFMHRGMNILHIFNRVFHNFSAFLLSEKGNLCILWGFLVCQAFLQIFIRADFQHFVENSVGFRIFCDF